MKVLITYISRRIKPAALRVSRLLAAPFRDRGLNEAEKLKVINKTWFARFGHQDYQGHLGPI